MMFIQWLIAIYITIQKLNQTIPVEQNIRRDRKYNERFRKLQILRFPDKFIEIHQQISIGFQCRNIETFYSKLSG